MDIDENIRLLRVDMLKPHAIKLNWRGGDMNNKLANELFFSKEAADYLGITTQRLNMLVKEGKIEPLKKTPSGTIFHIEELNKRKEEQSIFSKVNQGGGKGMFQLDSKAKIEALNFATLMNALDITEQRLDPLFTNFSECNDVTIPLNDNTVIDSYSVFFKVGKEHLLREFEVAEGAFSRLRETDEIIKRGSQEYPPLLAQTEQAPRFLYIRGKKSLLFEKRTVALVGSRQASDKAKDNTRRLTVKLGDNGITIVSGLAKGIDVTAHREALRNGYNTIAVIGTNLNQYYPAENKAVQMEIERKGLVVSQFSPANKTQRWFFPLRNGVMSGLSLATVIMEAGETSGALKQADFALKQGREVLIPKSALDIKTISWPAKYVKKGAKVVTYPRDVLELLADSNIFKIDENYQQQTFEDLIQDRTHETKQLKSQWISKVNSGE